VPRHSLCDSPRVYGKTIHRSRAAQMFLPARKRKNQGRRSRQMAIKYCDQRAPEKWDGQAARRIIDVLIAPTTQDFVPQSLSCKPVFES